MCFVLSVKCYLPDLSGNMKYLFNYDWPYLQHKLKCIDLQFYNSSRQKKKKSWRAAAQPASSIVYANVQI